MTRATDRTAGAGRAGETPKGDGIVRPSDPAPLPQDDYITPGEAARCLHVSPKTINRWANEGRIPCIVTLGGHRRFRRDDVAAALQQMGGTRMPSSDA
jgi:excisionase family DNA binding protein